MRGGRDAGEPVTAVRAARCGERTQPLLPHAEHLARGRHPGLVAGGAPERLTLEDPARLVRAGQMSPVADGADGVLRTGRVADGGVRTHVRKRSACKWFRMGGTGARRRPPASGNRTVRNRPAPGPSSATRLRRSAKMDATETPASGHAHVRTTLLIAGCRSACRRAIQPHEVMLRAAAMIPCAHRGISASRAISMMRPDPILRSRRGSTVPVSGSGGALLSKSCRLVSSGSSRIRLSRLLSYLDRIFSSGMS
jgi:hypothetical protein